MTVDSSSINPKQGETLCMHATRTSTPGKGFSTWDLSDRRVVSPEEGFSSCIGSGAGVEGRVRDIELGSEREEGGNNDLYGRRALLSPYGDSTITTITTSSLVKKKKEMKDMMMTRQTFPPVPRVCVCVCT